MESASGGFTNSAFNDVDLNEGSHSARKEASVDLKNSAHFKITKSGEVKYPRRLIHCSDGILEEYSTDEEEDTVPEEIVDPSTLTWGPYFWHKTVRGATHTLAACDYMGERLAWFFGITDHKYQSAITELQRMEEDEQEQDELKKAEEAAENEMIQKHLQKSKMTENFSSNETNVSVEQDNQS